MPFFLLLITFVAAKVLQLFDICKFLSTILQKFFLFAVNPLCQRSFASFRARGMGCILTLHQCIVLWGVGWYLTQWTMLICFCFALSHFDYIDIHKKARHEISLMSGKIEIFVRRLEDYQTLWHYTMYIHNVFFNFIHNRHLFAKWNCSHYFPILNR